VRSARPARKGLEDHLHQSKHGLLEDDLARNYAEDVVILTGFGTYRGHEGVRRLTNLLQEQLPNVSFEYRTILVDDEIGFLEWSARGDGAGVDDGVDSYLIRGVRIIAQTIHYTIATERLQK
jgi:hypothetical protein